MALPARDDLHVYAQFDAAGDEHPAERPLAVGWKLQTGAGSGKSLLGVLDFEECVLLLHFRLPDQLHDQSFRLLSSDNYKWFAATIKTDPRRQLPTGVHFQGEESLIFA